MNRRKKLGTSRRSKGRQNEKDAEVQPHVESKEDVQDEARADERPETHESTAKQLKVQEELGQESERDTTVPQVGFLVSATTAEYSEDKTGMFWSEEVEHISVSGDVCVKPFKDGAKLEVIESNNTFQSEKVNKDLHDVTSSSATALDQQISKQAEALDLYSVAETKGNKLDESGLFRQDGRLQGSSLVCESHVNTAITPVIAADNALRENVKINDGVEQETFLLQMKELSSSKDGKFFIIPEVRDGQHSEVAEENLYDQHKPTQVQGEHQNDNSAEDLQHDQENHDSYPENQKSESGSCQSMFLGKSTAAEETSLDHSGGLVEDDIKQTGESAHIILSETGRSDQSDVTAPTEPQHPDSSLTTHKSTEPSFGFGATKRKIGSSRRNKGIYFKDDIIENTPTSVSLETPTVLSEIQERSQEEVSKDIADDIILTLSHGSSVSLVTSHISSEGPEMSQFAGESTDHFTTKRTEHQTEGNVSEYTENVQLKTESYDLDEANYLQNCDLEKQNSAPSQVHVFKTGVEQDIKVITDQIFHLEKKGLFSEMDKKETVLFDYKLQDTSGREQSNQAFYSSGNRRKLGSNRKSKGRQQDQDSKEEVKEKSSSEETTQIDPQMIQEELRLNIEHDVLPVSCDGSMLSISAPGHSSEGQSPMPKIYPENDQQMLISGSVNSHEGIDKSETYIDMELSNKSPEETPGHQSDSISRKSGSHQTREVVGPYTDDDLRQSQEHEALQTQVQEPQQVDDRVDVQVEEGGVFVGDTKTISADPRVQDDSLSADQETDAGFSFGGSRRKLGSSRRNKARRQRKESTEKVLEDSRGDEMFETHSVITQEVVREDDEPGVIISAPNNSRFPISTLESPTPTKYQSDLQGLIMESEKHQENQNGSKSDTENILGVSKEAVEALTEDTIAAIAEDASTEIVGVEVYPAKVEKSLQVEHLSGTVPCDVAGLFQNISENLIDKAETSEFNLKSDDDSATKLEILTVDVGNKDSVLYDTNQPQISAFEKIDHVSTEVEESKGRVENNAQLTDPHTTDQAFDGKKKGLFCELEEGKTLPSNFQSEPVSFDSKPQEMPESVDEKTDTSFFSRGNRRKMGSKRSNEGRQQDEKSKDVEDKSSRVITHESAHITLETKTTIQEELQQDRDHNLLPEPNDKSMFTPVDSSEIQSFILNTYPETELVGLISKNVYCQDAQGESATDNNVELFEKYKKDTLANKSEALVSQEPSCPEHSNDAAKQAHEHEDPPTDIEGSLQMDHTSESVAQDVPKYPETVLGDMIDQAEIISSTQPEISVKSNDGSDTKQEVLPADDQQNQCFTTKGNVKTLDETNKYDYLYDSNETLINPVEVNTTFGQMDEGGRLVEVREYDSTDPRLQDRSLSTEEQTDVGFNFSGNRRKLGSSRRNKGRQGVKEATQEMLENPKAEEAIDTSMLSLKTKSSEQEGLNKDVEDDIILSVSRNVFISPVLSSEDKSPVVSKGPDTNLKSLVIKHETLQEDIDERNSNVSAQDGEQSDLSVSKYEALYSQDARETVLEDAMMKDPEEEADSITTQHSLAMGYCSEIASDNTTKTFDTMSGNLTDQGERSPLTMKSAEDFTVKQEEHWTQEILSETLDLENEEMGHYDTTPEADQMFHQEKEEVFCEMKGKKPALSNLQPEIVSSDPQPQETSESVDERINQDFSNSQSRRKLGSSRKSKAKRQVKEFKDDVHEKTWVGETPETTQVSLDTMTFNQEEQRQDVEKDMTSLVSSDNSIFSVFAPGDSSGFQSSMQNNCPETDQQILIQESHSEDQDESGAGNELSHKSEEDSLLDKSDVLESKDNALQDEEGVCPEHSDDAAKQDHEHKDPPTDIEGSLQMDHTSESVAHDVPKYPETVLGDMIDQAEIICSSQPQLSVKSNDGSDTNQEVLPADDQQNQCSTTDGKNRRQLGSSRRNKGRQGVKEATQETLENTRSDKMLHTPDRALEIRGVEQEDLSEEIEHKIILSLSQELSSKPSLIHSSEDPGFGLKKDPDTDLQIVILKNKQFGDKGERNSETEVEVIDKSINVLQQEMDQFPIIHSNDTRDAGSDYIFRKVEEVEVHPTQMQDGLQTECYSETVAGDISENEEVIPENPTDQAEISELTTKATHDCSTKEEANPRREKYPDASTVKNEGSGLFNINEPQITVGDDFIGRVSDDIKPNGDKIFHLEIEGLCKMEENSPTLPNLQTDMGPFDSLPREISQGVDEQPNKGSGNRRKLGSSRRSKGKQVKESKQEVKEKTKGVETLKTTQMHEELNQHNFSPDSLMFAPGDSSEIQSSMQNNCPETDLKILMQENHSEDQDESEAGRELSHKSEEDSFLDKSDVLESNYNAIHDKEVACPEHSDDAPKQDNEHKDPPTDIEGSLQMDHTSESVAHDVPKYPETVLGDMIDQAEIICSIQPELNVKSNDGSDTKQEFLPADDQQNLCFTTEGIVKALDETNKDQYLYDSNETSISSPVEVNTTSQVEDDRGLIGDIRHSSDNSQSQEASGSVNELSNRREKLGSSHKSKERQQDKDFKEEVKEISSSDEAVQISLDTQIMSQEELSLDMEHDNVLPVSHGSTLLSIFTPGESLEVQNSPSKMSAGNDQESLIPANVNILQGQDKSKTDINMELSNKSLEETSGHQPNPLNSKSGSHQTREVVGPYTDDDVRQSQKHEVLHTQVQEPQQVDGRVDGQVEEGGVFVGDTETSPADPRVRDNSLSADQETNAGFSFGGSRRKLGSSRRNKGRQQRKGSTEKVLEDDEMFESGNTRNAVSENIVNAVHEDVNSTQIQESLETYSYKTVSGDATENFEVISGTPTLQAEACVLKINSTEDIKPKEEASSSKEIRSDGLGLKNKETIHIDVRPNINQVFNQDKEGPFREMEGNTFVLSNFQSENIVSNSQPQESPESVVEQTKVEPRSRRKLGSSRRNKENSKAKDSTVETYNQLMKAVEEDASINEPCEKTTEKGVQDQEQSVETVPDEVVANDSPQTEDVNVGSSGCATIGIQPSSTLDKAVIDTSSCAQIIDRELNTPHSRDQEEYRELCMQHENSQESLMLSEPHACPPITEMHTKESSNHEHAEPESREGDGFKKGVEQETKPAQNPDMLLTTEKDGGDAARNPKANSKNLFNQTRKKSTEDIKMLPPDKNVHRKDLIAPPERATEKSSDMYQAQVEYSVEQCSVSSPHEMCSTDGEENKHIIFQSDKDATLDSQHQDTCQSLKDDARSGLKDDARSGLKASGSRRKLGSSRRNKGTKHDQVTEQHQESKVEAVENTGDDDRTEILAANAPVQEELENLTLPETFATFRSAVSEKLLEENTVSSHNILEDSTIATSDLNLISKHQNSVKSNAETKEKDANLINETEDSIQLTGHDTDIKGLMQLDQATVWRGDSDMQSILFHDDIISPGPESAHVTDQEEGLQRLNRETLSREKDPPGAEVHLQQTNNDIETIGFVTTEDYSSEVKSSMDVHNLKQEEEGEKCVFATAQQKKNSNAFVSASQEPAMDAFHKAGISTTVNTLESLREKPQVTLKQKKRKIGSSRRTLMTRKREGGTNVSDDTEESDFSEKADMMNLGEKEVVGDVPVNVEVLQGEDKQSQRETSMQQRTPETKTSDGLTCSNMSVDFPPEQSATIDRIKETQRPEDFTSTETQITSEIAERNGNLLNQPMSSNTDTPGVSFELFRDLPQETQGDEHSPENIEVRQVQDVQEQMPSSMTEGISSQNPGIRNTSHNLTPTNRRRKMGSTRKNRGTRTEQEILEAEYESTDTVTSSGDVSVLEEKETELQFPTEHTDNSSRQGNEKETVEISPFAESLLRALAEEAAEEGSISQKLMVETEREQSPEGLSSSPPTSQLASVGKRKKFGSNRKSGLQQRKAQQDTQPEDEAGGSTEGQAAEGEGSPGLRKISEVDENEVKASSSTSTLKAAEFSKPGRDGTPEKSFHDNIRLNQESGSQLSFGTTSGTDNSDCYNVVMIGESCVGKTSFMKRAQSGKFSLDLPASVGLDSCKWTVVVDGKPVLLQLWDTAGQERFHSITRQVFHKAQAFLLMYDITCSQSFSAVSYWANSIQEAAPEDVTVLLLGNKSDHAKRQVKTEQGDVLAKEYNFEFMECSAATGENVIEALETVARMLSQRADLLREEVTVLHREPGQRNRSKCC